MIWDSSSSTCNIRKKKMGLRKQQHLTCLLSLLLLIMIILKDPKFVLGYGRFNKFNHQEKHQQQQGDNRVFTSSSPSSYKRVRTGPKPGDDVFEDDKRKVRTGPNPLHNR